MCWPINTERLREYYVSRLSKSLAEYGIDFRIHGMG
jgi:hypothetical protein